ncbi:hypothetical protein [Streptosporangium vulgare]|uniref:hypothetical protein n=1 Tax=Streptosporangium vulgare TaxID=46190 RepID=UPI0031CF85C2
MTSGGPNQRVVRASGGPSGPWATGHELVGGGLAGHLDPGVGRGVLDTVVDAVAVAVDHGESWRVAVAGAAGATEAAGAPGAVFELALQLPASPPPGG